MVYQEHGQKLKLSLIELKLQRDQNNNCYQVTIKLVSFTFKTRYYINEV